MGAGRAAAGVEALPDRSPGEFPVQAAFLPLAPGAVEPAGWLRDWALAAGDGITGHLDEYHPTFHDAWKNKADRRTAWQTNEGSLEQCAYWLDGLLRLGYLLHDEQLIRKATDRLSLVVEGVNRGGNSFLYWQTKPPKGFLAWAHSQMGRAFAGCAVAICLGQRGVAGRGGHLRQAAAYAGAVGLAAGGPAGAQSARPGLRLATDRRPALPAAPVEGGQARSIGLVPYGCTKFRISMFPVTARSWQAPPGASQK